MKLLYFSKDNCGPCKVVKPRVETVAELKSVPVEYIDCGPDRSEAVDALLAQYQIRTVPVVVVLDPEGKAKAQLSGTQITVAALEVVL